MSQPKISLSRRSFLTKSCLAAGTISALSAPRHTKAAPTQTASATQGDGTPDSFGSRPFPLPFDVPQYFFDDARIAYQRKLVRRWLPAVVNPKPVMVADRPWESSNVTLRGTILPTPGGGYRMYYSSGGNVLVAFSTDGLGWRKPDLDACLWEGKPSNMVIQRQPPVRKWSIASSNVIYDEQDAKYPYKLTSFQKPDKTKEGGLFVYQSADGLHFEAIPGMRFEMGDRNTMIASRVNGKFVGYVRKKGFFKTAGVRSLFYTESENFLDWSEPQLSLAPDLQDEPDVEFYGMVVFRRHGWFIGLVEYWRSDADVFEIQLAFSRDGKTWQRPQPRTPFMSGVNHCVGNGPIYLNEQMAFYVVSNPLAHHKTTTTREDFGISLASLELDRFCALEGTTEHGWVDTMPLVWPGGSLVVNADTRESYASHPTKTNGELFVEVLDESGKQLPEWCAKKRATFQGNTHCREKISDGTVKWPGGRNLDEFTGRAIRLRFGMKHARLFTFEARKPA